MTVATLPSHSRLTDCFVIFLCLIDVSAFAGLQSSSVQAQSDIDTLAAELTAAVQRRHAELTQQLQQQKQVSRPDRKGAQFNFKAAASSAQYTRGCDNGRFPFPLMLTRRASSLRCFPFVVQTAAAALTTLLVAADRTAAEGAQLRAAVAAASTGDDYDTLADAPRVAQLCSAMRDQLRVLENEVAEAAGPSGCVVALRLKDGAKAETLSALAQLGTFTQQRAKFTLRPSAAADGPLRQLESRVLPAASEADLLQLFEDIAVDTGRPQQRARSMAGCGQVPIAMRLCQLRCSFCSPSQWFAF